MEDLITTPKRTDEPAFKLGATALSSQTRQNTQQRIPQSSILAMESQQRHNHQSRVQTEEGVDGAQAIENESDRTFEDEANAGVPPSLDNVQHQAQMQKGSGSVGEALVFHMMQQQQVPSIMHQNSANSQSQPLLISNHTSMPAYTHENSSFGIQHQQHQNNQVLQASATSPLLGKNTNVRQPAGHHQPAEEDSDAVIIVPRDSMPAESKLDASATGGEDSRRGRSMRHASYKNLFSKNAAYVTCDSRPPSQIFDESQTASKVNPMMGAGLAMSRSEHNFQYLLDEEEDESAADHNCMTDEEIFDQDGGQDGAASNFIDVDESEDQSQIVHQVGYSPQKQVQQAMMNFRRANAMPIQQPIPSYGTWVQEPHIDEELSDEEEDHSSGESSPKQQFVTCVNVEDQTDEEEAIDEDEEPSVHAIGIEEMKREAEKVLATEGDEAIFDDEGIVKKQSQVYNARNCQNLIESDSLDRVRTKFSKNTPNDTKNGKFDSKTASTLRQLKHGYQTPMEVSDPNLPPKSSQTTQKKKTMAVNRSRMKAHHVSGSMKLHKLSSIDFSQPALSPSRALLQDGSTLGDENSTLGGTKGMKKDIPSRGTPRQQPITNFQLQQEQAKLIRHRQMAANQKMNHTAFGSSSIMGKGNTANHSQTLVSQTLHTLNEKQLKSKETLQSRQKNANISQSNLLNYNNSASQSNQNMPTTQPAKSKAIKNQSNSSIQKVGSSSSKKQGGGGVDARGVTSNGGQKIKNSSSSIFITAKQTSANGSQQAHAIKPFTTEGPTSEQNEASDQTSKLQSSVFSSASPDKRLTTINAGSRSNAQAAAISMGSSLLQQIQGTNKSQTKSAKERTLLKSGNSGTNSAQPSAFVTANMRTINCNQQSMTNLQSYSNSYSVKHNQDQGKIGPKWNNSQSQQQRHESTISQLSKPSQPSTLNQVPKSASMVKESNSTLSLMMSGGYPSHTAARAHFKRGFLKEANQAVAVGDTQTQSVKSSTAQINVKIGEESSLITADEQQKLKNQRSSSKGKKKNSAKQSSGQSALRAKRGSMTNAQQSLMSGYLTTDVSQTGKTLTGAAAALTGLKTSDSRAAQQQMPATQTKNVDQISINMSTGAKPGQIFSSATAASTAATRQRTNTTLGLQSSKNSSLRQSMNNLALQDLVLQQPVTGTGQKTSTKQQSTRGNASGKNNSHSVSNSHSFSASTTANYKSNTLTKTIGGLTGQSKKNNSNLLASQINSKANTDANQINDRVEQLTGKSSQVLSKKNGGAQGTISGASKGSKRADTTKLRSQSTLKNHAQASGVGNQHVAGNTSLLNFTSQPQERKSNNIQHSIIIAAVENGKSNPSQKSHRQGNQSAAQGTKNTHESKRTSVNGNNARDWGLADFERAQYGDRCPKGYEKLRLLGKGGAAVVWLAQELRTGRQVALKQFPKPKNAQGQPLQNQGVLDPTAKIEIEMGRLLFSQNTIYNGYSINPKEFPGILRIAKLYEIIEESRDVWLSYQVGGQCLTNHLFDVKGESYKGERIYGVQHQGFYRALKEDKQVLVDLIRMMAEVADVLAMFRIVHADIKPDNILIDFDGRRVKDIKLIDFGSAFSYESPSNISATTPEYLAPEVLDYLERRGQNTDANGMNSTNLCRMQEPWSYDMWSMGAILLELLTGIPLWMSLKCRAQTQTGKQLFGMGIFGVQGRQGKKIIQKQNTSLKNLQSTLKKYDCYGLDKDPIFMDLLVKMLDSNPLNRISPIEVLEHPFIKNKHETLLASKN